MKLEKETALIEAILFLEHEPLDVRSLANISELPRDVVLEAIACLQERYCSPDCGMEITEIANGFLMSPKNELWSFLKNRYGKRNENSLSRAAMETLSIIAYSQPITKSEIESMRGVSADGMIRLLSEKNLIKTVGKKDAPGRPIQYGTTAEFLKSFRLSSIADLPRLDELDQERFGTDQ